MRLLALGMLVTALFGQTPGTIAVDAAGNITATAGALVCTGVPSVDASVSVMRLTCSDGMLPPDTPFRMPATGAVTYSSSVGSDSIVWSLNGATGKWEVAANGIRGTGVFASVPEPPVPSLAVVRLGKTSISGTAANVKLLASPAAGSIILVSAGIYAFPQVTKTLTDNLGQTYDLVSEPAMAGRLAAMWYVRTNTAPGVTDITLRVSPADHLRLHIYEVVGGGGVDGLSVAAKVLSSVTGSLDVTTATAPTVVFGNFSGGSTTLTSAGADWTLGESDDSVAGVPITLSDVYRIVTAPGVYSPGVSWAPGQGIGWSGAAVAIGAKRE